ncbi:MAG: asparagine synthase (glutamine-hydrolyzing) [Chloroflexota bacterium]|nr:asparagine synthase (glutamine-hydrolyzing) [Chloroflexota bacterium]
MCGLCGVLHLDGAPADAAVVERMTGLLLHRGPDQGRVIVDGRVALGNRRLAIQDLSPAGALPMQSSDGALTLAYNGEIYNYPALKAQMEAAGERFASHSDAEAILKLYRQRGFEMFTPLRGMFALALWDAPNQQLLLARDRLGEKPLYYYHDAHILAFASEIKALLAHPAVPRQSAFDAHRLALYLAYGYLPAPETAFVGVRALRPGHYLHVVNGTVREGCYWSPPPNAAPNETADVAAHRQHIHEALEDAVRQALISDVPLGAFLSGGLDSSLIVALMRRHSNSSVKTFSIGFEGDHSFDETRFARQVAQHLQTDHTAFTVKPDAVSLLPKLVWHHDQPFGDSSAIPTYLVSKLAREQVTVALTGDGGDELFAGYDRFRAASLVGRVKRLPAPLLHLADALLSGLPEGTRYDNRIKRARRFVRGARLPFLLAYFDWVRLFSGDISQTLLQMDGKNAVPTSGAIQRFRKNAIHGVHADRVLSHDPAADDYLRRAGAITSGETVAALLDVNLQTYLPDDLLIKTDRSSMAASLETRAPFLDHVLVEAAARLPLNLKLNGMTSKWLLKEIAADYLPHDIIHRPKHGFGVPLGAWLRADIAPVRDILLGHEARQRGLFDITAVARLLDDHADGKRDHAQRLWALLTLEWWHRLFIDPSQLAAP